jgi:hypothetical protein
MADPFSAWGPEAAPDRLIRQDALKEGEIAASIQERLGRVAMQPAQKRLLEAKAGELESEVRERQQAAELMKRAFGQDAAAIAPELIESGTVGAAGLSLEQQALGTGRRVSIADKFGNAAEVFAGAGMVEQAKKLAESAALIRQREASQISSQTTALLNQLKIGKEQAENLAQFFGGAGGQDEWDMANRLYSFQTGQQSPFANVPFNEEVVDALNQRALSAKDRYDLADKAATRENTKRYRDERLKDFDEQNKIRKEQLRLNREREERLKKAGGTTRLPSADPKNTEIDHVKSLLKKDFPAANDDAQELNTAAFTIAAEARAKLRANPALSPSAAINQAYTEAMQQGDISLTEGKLFGIGKKFRFAGGGRSPETALTVPSKAAEAKVGRYYVNSAGQIAKWDGKRFVPVQVSSNRLSGNNSDLSREEAEE